MSEDNSEITAWTAIENGLLNLSEYVNLTNPTKDGFVCSGWTTVQGGTDVQYNALNEVPTGLTVYPVWAEYVDLIPEIPETPENDKQPESDNTGN